MPPALYEWRQIRGLCTTAPESVLPEGFVSDAENLELDDLCLLKPRPGTADVSLTSGPSYTILRLWVEELTTSATLADQQALWAFGYTLDGAVVNATPVAYRRTSAGWASVALTDTPAESLPFVTAAKLNGKVYLAYNSGSNRLHLWDGSAVRRVGLGLPSAPTVANTGAGAYAATLRYYKVNYLIVSGSDTIATSELSAEVSFTPSGAGTAARVTKPATIDSATHWQVWASADNVTYYKISGQIAVATTTYDDSATPSAYDGDVPFTEGSFLPPPSCKFLAVDGTRLLMAGAHESSASSGEVAPKANRVWFTRPLGATDVGDDESILITVDQRYYLDVAGDQGAEITAMVSETNGTVYVFQQRGIHRLIATGLDDAPYRAERLARDVGVVNQDQVCIGDTEFGEQAVYFMDVTGPYRISQARGLEWLGEDVFSRGLTTDYSSYFLTFWPIKRQLLIGVPATNGTTTVYALAVDMLSRMGRFLRGGWMRWDVGWDADPKAMAVHLRTLYLSGRKTGSGIGTGGARLRSCSDTATGDGTTAVTAYAVGKPLVASGGKQRIRANAPMVELEDITGVTEAGYLADGIAMMGQVTTQNTGDTVAQVVTDAQCDGVRLLQPKVSMEVSATQRRVLRLVVPYTAQETLT
jgi:hypothetical protein